MIQLSLIMLIGFITILYITGMTKDVINKKEHLSKKSEDYEYSLFVDKIKDIYNKDYNSFHTYNYIHHKMDDFFQTYKSKIILSDNRICSIELTDKYGNEINNLNSGISNIDDNLYKITDCYSLKTNNNLTNSLLKGEKKMLNDFTPPKPRELNKLYGVIFSKVDYIKAINGAIIPKLNLSFSTLNKRDLKVNKIIPIDTYSIVNAKIEKASDIIDYVSNYARSYAKSIFKSSINNPYSIKDGMIPHKFLYSKDSGLLYSGFIKNSGTSLYNFSTSPFILLPNSDYYDNSNNQTVFEDNYLKLYYKLPISLRYQKRDGKYSVNDYTTMSGETLYAVKYKELKPGSWNEQYDLPYRELSSGDLYELFYRQKYMMDPIKKDEYNFYRFNLKGLDDYGAVRKVRVANNSDDPNDYSDNSNYFIYQFKKTRDYFKDVFHLEFNSERFINPFYGKSSYFKNNNYKFDILVDNGSEFVYDDLKEYKDISESTLQIIKNFKIAFALPYVRDCIDTLKNCDESQSLYDYDYEGLYFKVYSISIIK